MKHYARQTGENTWKKIKKLDGSDWVTIALVVLVIGFILAQAFLRG